MSKFPDPRSLTCAAFFFQQYNKKKSMCCWARLYWSAMLRFLLLICSLSGAAGFAVRSVIVGAVKMQPVQPVQQSSIPSSIVRYSAKKFMAKGFGTTKEFIKTDDSLGLFTSSQEENVDGEPCACHSSLLYAECCQNMRTNPFKQTYEPEQLVRARYGAYAMGLTKFLIATSHQNARVGVQHHHACKNTTV